MPIYAARQSVVNTFPSILRKLLMLSTTTPLPGSLGRLVLPDRSPALQRHSLKELGAEIVARIHNGEFTASEEAIFLGCEINEALYSSLDIHNNRLSRKHYADLFSNFCEWEKPVREILRGATVVELGCGSINPYGLMFLFLMVGANRAIAIDLDEIQNSRRAVKSLADLAGMMLVNPASVVGTFPVSRQEVIQNIDSFDLARLQAGDESGVDFTRLMYRQDSVHSLSLSNGEADIVISAAFLEHITSVDDAIGEIARTTRKGGIGVHIIDGSDHYRYSDPNRHSLEFLTDATHSEVVNGSNRIRPVLFAPLFERHGFEVISVVPFEHVEITSDLRSRLAAPFYEMPDEVLTIIGAKIVTRRL